MNWEIGLCEIGDPSLCLLSFIAPPCGAAVARHYLDQSPILFNICCLNPIAARWLIRTAYNINGDDVDDMCVGVFCPCCSINQILQTAKKKKNPTIDGGYFNNTENWSARIVNDCCSGYCIYSVMCPCCAVGSTLYSAIGMPWWLACCCVKLPCMAHNIIRYQFRIRGEDEKDELCNCYRIIGRSHVVQESAFRTGAPRFRYLTKARSGSGGGIEQSHQRSSVAQVAEDDGPEPSLKIWTEIFDGTGLSPLQIKKTEILMRNQNTIVQAIPFTSVHMHLPEVRPQRSRSSSSGKGRKSMTAAKK